MTSKRFRGRPCAYCLEKTATTADHVIARELFLPEDRGNLPKVPSCGKCNNQKSAIENYVLTALLAGSNHIEGQRYRRDFVRKRLARNHRVQREIGLYDPPRMLNVNGVIRPMHALRVDSDRIERWVEMLTLGLYHHHFSEPLSKDFYPDAAMKHPDHEAAIWAHFEPYFPLGCHRGTFDFGRGAFTYEYARSPAHRFFTVWRMNWHGGISLYGPDAPPQGVHTWWSITRPTDAAFDRMV